MAARISKLAPPAAQSAPDQETREQGLKVLRLELESQKDAGLAALLQHEIARLHERRDDLASAARDELAATKSAAGFVEPVESLIDIATRSRSKANLAKLLERLTRLARDSDEHLRASLALAFVQVSTGDFASAESTLDEALQKAPGEPALWIALEALAAETGSPQLLLRAARGRAAHSQSEALRCLFLERVSRLHELAGDHEEAFAALRQSADELPSWRTVHAWEELGIRTGNYLEAGLAALQTASILRGGLEEPDEAQLYQIPEEERDEERAFSAHVRAIVYAVRSGRDEDARGLCEHLVEASPQSALALSLQFEVCRKQRDLHGSLQAILKLIGARKWSLPELAVLNSVAAITATSLGNEEEASRLFAELSNCAPESLLPDVQKWIAAEKNGSNEALSQLLDEWSLGNTPEADAFAYAATLIHFISGNVAEARELHSKIAQPHDRIWVLLDCVLGHADSKNPHHLYPPEIGSRNDRQANAWEALRFTLSHPERSTADAQPETLEGDSWAKLILELLQGDLDQADRRTSKRDVLPREVETTQDFKVDEAVDQQNAEDQDGVIIGLTSETPFQEATTEYIPDNEGLPPAADSQGRTEALPVVGLRRLVERCQEEGKLSADLRQALDVLLLAAEGDELLLRAQWEQEPSNALLSGALLACVQRATSESGGAALTLAQVLHKAASSTQDDTLRAAWILRNAGLALSQRNAAEARHLIGTSGALEHVAQISAWLEAFSASTDPQTELSRWEGGAQAGNKSLEQAGLDATALQRAALTRRWAPSDFASLEVSRPSSALQILRVVHNATVSLEALEYALDETDLFTPAERAVLPLARDFSLEETSELFEASARWVRACPSLPSRLTHLVAAIRASNQQARASMIEGIASDTGNIGLLTSVNAHWLKKDSRIDFLNRLAQARDAASPQDKKALSWSLVEQMDDDLTEAHAHELRQLSQVLDETCDDADAQIALLVSGFEYLALGMDEHAVGVFERLMEVLPGDLTVCLGARIAAQRNHRPDIEATASCELARATEDNRKSSLLWERAGVLYQDVLQNPAEAEKCFTAALGRSPGSRLAFERVYRFARDRNDRARQVELIDARIDTADSESLLVELYWEKARFCRMLGRRTIALRSVVELLRLAPDHLPALALAAELHLADGRLDEASEALREVARHPDTPPRVREAAGLYACDLFEQLKKPRDAVELLQLLDEHGVSGSAGLARRARSLARSEDWGAAYQAFAQLNSEQDEIVSRLESARMMLAIQRDHLKDVEELKHAARAVLRDAPLDPDAVQIVLAEQFPLEERRRLLTPARSQSQSALRKDPLNPPEIHHFGLLCRDSGIDYLERISLGNLGLIGKLADEESRRLAGLRRSCLPTPSEPLSRANLEALADPLQIGSAGRYIKLLSHYLAQELDPSLDALGVSSLMRTDEFSGSPHRAEIGTWVACFGDNDFELYVGGTDPHLIRGMHGDLPTLVVGAEVQVPLSDVDRARVLSQLSALHYDTVTFLNHSPKELEPWIRASEILAGAHLPSETAGPFEEMARALSKRMPREVREELTHLRSELERAGVALTQSPYVVMRGAARAACLGHGDAMILRQLPELLPDDQEHLDLAMADIVKFVLSQEFINIRRKIGLEGA